MPAFRLALIAIISSVSTLVLAAGCDAVRSSLTSSATPTAVQAPATPTAAAAAQAPTAAQPAPPAAAQAPPPTPQPVAAGQGMPKPGAVAAAPVAQAAPAAQSGSPYDTVIRVYRDWRPSVVTVISRPISHGLPRQARGERHGLRVHDRRPGPHPDQQPRRGR